MVKKHIYNKCLYLYGFMTLLYLIEGYIKDENYEECQIIFDVLKEHNNYFGHDLPTELNELTFEYFEKAKAEFKLKANGLNMIPFYVEEVKKLIKK